MVEDYPHGIEGIFYLVNDGGRPDIAITQAEAERLEEIGYHPCSYGEWQSAVDVYKAKEWYVREDKVLKKRLRQ